MAKMVSGHKTAVASARKSPHTKAKGSIPGKVRVHPHTAKQLKNVAVNSGIKHHSVGGTGNGVAGADPRY